MEGETKYCAVCNMPMKFIKAGISKTTGRPYNAFWACPNRCKQPRPTSEGLPTPPEDTGVKTVAVKTETGEFLSKDDVIINSIKSLQKDMEESKKLLVLIGKMVKALNKRLDSELGGGIDPEKVNADLELEGNPLKDM